MQRTADEVSTAGRCAEIRSPDLTRLPRADDVVDDLADALGGIGVLACRSGVTPGAPETSPRWRSSVLRDRPLLGRTVPAGRRTRGGVSGGADGQVGQFPGDPSHGGLRFVAGLARA